eukprot:COSAG04_NODE_22637_length_351_cov_1.019841_1_plen_24_part_10
MRKLTAPYSWVRISLPSRTLSRLH